MLTLHTKLGPGDERTPFAQLVLPYDQREKCRLRAVLSNGDEVAVFTVRGTVLRDGERMTGPEGQVVQIVAAREPTYLVRCADAHTLLRVAAGFVGSQSSEAASLVARVVLISASIVLIPNRRRRCSLRPAAVPATRSLLLLSCSRCCPRPQLRE